MIINYTAYTYSRYGDIYDYKKYFSYRKYR